MRYKNELILFGAIIFLLGSYLHKSNIVQDIRENSIKSKQEYAEIIKTYNLQKIWSNKIIAKKIERLKNIVSSSKITWTQKGNKLTAKYKALSKDELNKVLNKLLNLPVQIKVIDIKRNSKVYDMELQCKW
jgi:urease accessory protein UreH